MKWGVLGLEEEEVENGCIDAHTDQMIQTASQSAVKHVACAVPVALQWLSSVVLGNLS